ncbi:MAG TPA: HD domain-containing phosphohydrolase, partial [Actinomycetota bacterium]|nr:HD domain-containing phosphohydrolase [Actinomycetota bacterium]
MRTREHFVNVGPFFGLALLATAAVVGIPFVLVLAWVSLGDPSAIGLVLAALVSMSVVFALGAALWKTRAESADISFGELMIWGWLLRKRADEQLHEGARLLGLDRSGQPQEAAVITPERQIAVLHELNAALESKDPYTHGHSQRVERHVYRTGAAMGLSSSAIEELRFAAALHDVGKIRLPDRVLRKPSGLTAQERTIVEEHVVVGAWMVSNVASADVVSAVRHHHERWDGRGYPDGLAGTDIPLYARVIAVADAYDAITSTRPYRTSAGREHAIDVLRA